MFPDAFLSFFLFFTLIPRIVSCLPYSIWGGIRISEVSLKRVLRDTTRTRRERRKKETDTEGDHTTNNFFDNSRQYRFWDFIRRRQAPRLNPYPSKESSPELSGCEACFSHHQSLICSTMSLPEAIPMDPARYIKKFAGLGAPPGRLSTGRAKGAPGGIGPGSGTIAAAMGTTRLAGTGPRSVVEKFPPSTMFAVTSIRAS